ncbi:MAG TPA: DUF692 domain-containing protein [Thermoanaerobaculia bacterium]|nr:DUF692 domain-containing protein [Thermoanaerobaculia bacterium]
MRYGIGWRAELGAGILANLDRIDVVEVLAEELFHATRAQQRALRFLRSHVPIVLHATSLGLASTEPVDARRLDALARVVDWLEPELWSEHLAFVRAGGREVGHLAAPPRNDATLEGLVRNVAVAARVTGSLPCLENVASLIEPPLSTYSEEAWLHAVVAATGCELLLDLHNLYANAHNFGFDAFEVVRSLPAPRLVHLAGGRRIEGDRVLDDHLHAVPSAVYELLAYVPGDATVILERDGNYPAISELLAELDAARRVVAHPPLRGTEWAASPPVKAVAGAALQVFLATLYTDADARARFLADPELVTREAGLPAAVAGIDSENLRLAARSFAKKRARHI